jgi:hypothetical protein
VSCRPLAQFGTKEVPPLEKWQRHIEKARFTRLEFKFLSTLWRWAARPELSFSRASFGLRCYHHPGPTFWTGDARARNAIRHIEIVLQPRPGPFACGVNDSSWSAICLVVGNSMVVFILGGEPGLLVLTNRTCVSRETWPAPSLIVRGAVTDRPTPGCAQAGTLQTQVELSETLTEQSPIPQPSAADGRVRPPSPESAW